MKNSRANDRSAATEGVALPSTEELVTDPRPNGVGDTTAFARRLVTLAEEVGTSGSVEEAAQRVVDALVGSLSLCDHAFLSARTGKNSSPVTAYSDDVAKQLGDSQVFLGSAPRLHVTLADPGSYSLTDHSDDSWNGFLERAAALNIRSLYAARLASAERRIGLITMYSTSLESFDRHEPGLITVAIDHIAIELQHRIEVANLNRALSTRSLIGTALGILMERHGISEPEAWKLLSKTSQELNIRLVDICRRLVNGSEG
ncbi:ANTAR domain-containing response regulator [Marinactinospora thermotolerans]|uniref:Response regulator with putative antiterminator output domain n=1 Tax=Marinactinospora thermotolerans DSM 45154 TaxID=1122192 RepID=A0A1T4R5T7_9ACTN|nr:ANTAR domain-containing protein [Marinactinospora thermotolerans]SKA11255.1 Response regulator with putative antiterminator output domain [Marinactinospora thermotolerans DSM 45154]